MDNNIIIYDDYNPQPGKNPYAPPFIPKCINNTFIPIITQSAPPDVYYYEKTPPTSPHSTVYSPTILVDVDEKQFKEYYTVKPGLTEQWLDSIQQRFDGHFDTNCKDIDSKKLRKYTSILPTRFGKYKSKRKRKYKSKSKRKSKYKSKRKRKYKSKRKKPKGSK
jgi:hypothetical protein